MHSRKVGAAVLAGLLYGQSLLGLVAVVVLVERNAGWGTPTGGYGVAATIELAQADTRPGALAE